MAARTVVCSGDTDWNWPCLHLKAAELVDARVSWLTEAGEAFALPATDISEGAYTASVNYVPGEGAETHVETLVDVTIEDDAMVIADLDVSALSGVYRADLLLTDSEGRNHYVLPFLMSVEKNPYLDASLKAATISELRMFLYDRLSAENLVEGAQEFPDRTMFDGMCWALRTYNDVPPDIAVASHVNTFPERNALITGAAAYVLGSYNQLLARNRLTAPGQVDAEQRLSVYADLANMYRRRFMQWIAEYKRIKDTGDGWGYA